MLVELDQIGIWHVAQLWPIRLSKKGGNLAIKYIVAEWQIEGDSTEVYNSNLSYPLSHVLACKDIQGILKIKISMDMQIIVHRMMIHIYYLSSYE